ncbi:keratin-associated protein 19-2-like [Limulus polyphemus]|uniref:Keratin-associated protein 19-2-like n=1 Tax=Limulus polyphemus TaxID=6850 RepID=A0ABM1B8M0_LIMPO|nr:keratin-associated protein 19-2-like [Limulus polyphemus]
MSSASWNSHDRYWDRYGRYDRYGGGHDYKQPRYSRGRYGYGHGYSCRYGDLCNYRNWSGYGANEYDGYTRHGDYGRYGGYGGYRDYDRYGGYGGYRDYDRYGRYGSYRDYGGYGKNDGYGGYGNHDIYGGYGRIGLGGYPYDGYYYRYGYS